MSGEGKMSGFGFIAARANHVRDVEAAWSRFGKPGGSPMLVATARFNGRPGNQGSPAGIKTRGRWKEVRFHVKGSDCI